MKGRHRLIYLVRSELLSTVFGCFVSELAVGVKVRYCYLGACILMEIEFLYSGQVSVGCFVFMFTHVMSESLVFFEVKL